jgi:HAE1 family hydrophobic/amphiphilic exporter-1
VEKAVKAKMAELARVFPQGLASATPFDTTVFVNESIREVYKTLIEAAVLVLLVISIFLQDWRAMLIPATTVPVTIIGAFAAMWALHRELLDAVRHRALDRHRCRRRHRRGGERLP